ncbi:hypothetical protein BH09BAC4_BH09BAC4_22970 [soil metagenome]
MKLEIPFLIAESKLTNYLLVPLPRDDKSNYLRLADYQLANWSILKKDLLTLVETCEATFEGSSVFGDSYSIVGNLVGPNGRSLMVKTIWMKEKKTGFTKFITLYPP